MSEKELTELGI